MTKTLVRWVTASVIILLVATASLYLGRNETESFPSPLNTKPSGLGSFSELLTRDGYHVTVDRSTDPQLDPDDLVVIPCLVGETLSSAAPRTNDSTVRALQKFVKRGGKVLVLVFDLDFVESSNKARTQDVIPWSQSKKLLQVSTAGSKRPEFELFEDAPSYAVLDEDPHPLLQVRVVGNGLVIEVGSAIGSSNRFLSRDDNAEFYLDLVHRMGGPDSRLVFLNSVIGDSVSTGIIGSFGPWAVATQWQFIFVLLVIGVTLGQRFGAPILSTRSQRGARQLVDSLASVFKTSGKQQFASQIVMEQALKSHRQRKRLSVTLSDADIVATLSSQAQSSYNRVFHSEMRLDKETALSLARIFVRELESEEWHRNRR